MAHDKNHCELKKGDIACVCIEVTSVSPNEEYVNLTAQTCEPMFPGTEKTPMSLNCRQVQRCCPCPVGEPVGGPHEDFWPYPGSLPPNMVMRVIEWLRGINVDPKEAAHMVWHLVGYGLAQWDTHPPVVGASTKDDVLKSETAKVLEEWSEDTNQKMPASAIYGLKRALTALSLLVVTLLCLTSPVRAEGWTFPAIQTKGWTFDSCNCVDTGVCLCDPAKCRCGPGCPQHCSEHASNKEKTSYREMRRRVAEGGSRGVVWVGGTCAPCVRELSDHLHCTVSTFQGVEEAGAVLIEGRNGEAYISRTWDGRFPSPAEVRSSSVLGIPPVSYRPTGTPYLSGHVWAETPMLQGYGVSGFYGNIGSYGGGGCANGSCGTGGGMSRGFFGRRR